MPKADMQGALFFSDKEPHITGYLVIGGIDFEIAGWRVNSIKSEVKARRRDGKDAPRQLDILEDVAPAEPTGDKWRDLGPARQAGIRCKDPIFWAFLSEECVGPKIASEEAAALFVRDLCCVASRSELNHPGKQRERVLWTQLDDKFQAWKAREHA